jgi:monoterpene epsilon-lactone hydrolase
VTDRQLAGRTPTQLSRPSLAMRLVGALVGARARRLEGWPVDLARTRRVNDRITQRLRVPQGVTMTEEVIGGVPVLRLSSGGGARGTVLFLHGGAYALGSARQALASVAVCTDGGTPHPTSTAGPARGRGRRCRPGPGR